MNGDQQREDDNNVELHSLLSQTIHGSWRPIYEYIQRHPHKARERYYRNESLLQMALKAREERRWNRERSNDDGGTYNIIERIHVLQALVDADPTSIYSRDEEGRSCLHTACTAGRSEDILRWLIKAEEECQSLSRKHHDHKSTNDEHESIPQRNATLRTDYPGGAVPLHSIAACPTFDCTSLASGRPTPQHPSYDLPMNIPCHVNPNIISAYASTTIIRQAHPQAVWDRDCEGEIPLHAAASWGNVGSVLALLVGVSGSGGLELARAALTADDRNKTPLDRACERVCSLCVHGREYSTMGPAMIDRDSSRIFRRSITREDPFQASVSSNDGGRSLTRRVGSGRRRIPGCGSSFRSSLSSSFVGGGGLVLDNIIGEDGISNESSLEPTGGSPPGLRASFISPRRPIDPIRGLESLDRDGEEELAKVEMLARAAACGFFEVGNILYDDAYEDFPLTETKPPTSLAPPSETTMNSINHFQLLHAVTALGCRPEIIWHVAAKHPHQVAERDEFGRVPLFLACERLAALYSRHAVKRQIILTKETKDSTTSDIRPSSYEVEEGDTNEDDMYRKFVESFLLGGDHPLLLQVDKAHHSAQATQPQPLSSSESSPSTEIEKKPSSDDAIRDDDLMEHLSLTQEVINILLYSPLFGQSEMASVPNNENADGRLALHIVLEAGLQWAEGTVHGCGSSEGVDSPHSDGEEDATNSNNSKTVVQILVDVYPRALEVNDGKTGLFPFMIAATPKALHTSNELEDECTKQLETVYQLLLKAPTMLCHHF